MFKFYNICMLFRKNFTSPEWQTLQSSLIFTTKYISLSQKSLIGDFQEKISASYVLTKYAEDYPDTFLKSLSDYSNYKSPINLDDLDDSLAVESPTLQSIKESKYILKNYDQESLGIYINLIRDLCVETAEISGSVNSDEVESVNKIIEELNKPVDEIDIGYKYQL